MAKKGKLDREDEINWQKITRTISPLGHKKNSDTYIHISPKTRTETKKQYQQLQINNDKKTRRGRVEIEMVIDLHEKTRDTAFAYLKSRLQTAHNKKLLCVLVITGKGKNMGGVLRTSLAGWLNEQSVRPLVSSYSPAHSRHGGAGAFYVFLKKK